MENISGIMDEVISKIAADLGAKKDKLILDRIRENFTFDKPFVLEDESKRMFPRIKCVYDSRDQSEHWYWNDGSIEGFRLISFCWENAFDFNNYNNKATTTLKHW